MKPGECYDKHHKPIYPGDLLKTYHFTGARRKRYYLYHVAVLRDGRMWMVPASHLEPTKQSGGGSCLLEHNHEEMEIIDGYGPGSTHFEDRPKCTALSAEKKSNN